MLSISARGNAQAAAQYYEHLQTDPAGRELEDYYATESTGIFLGAGAETLGLDGPVSRENFEDLAQGLTPLGEVMGAGMDHRAGWDLTWSAPKSVSILWATADAETREKIEAAHDKAVAAGLEFMEAHAAFGRRGTGGEIHEKVSLVAAAYRHGTSREQDPQLHSHCFVFNAAPRSDGTVGAIESRYLYEWKMAGGAAYRAELAQGLRELGYTTERDGKSFRMAGVSKELETEFSKRRNQIEQALKEHSARGAKASEIAALDTRQAKQSVDRETLLRTWQQTAREIAPEWQPSQCLRLAQQQVAPPLDVTAAQKEMTRQHSTVSEAQLYASVGQERQVHGNISDIEKSVAAVKADPETVALESHQGERYTTKEMQSLEADMAERAERMSRAQGHEVPAEKIQAAMDARPTLSGEQKAAVQHVTGGGDLACVQGDAGTGKSFMLAAAREAWESEGFRVRGASLSGKAAQELEQASGIQSTTLKRLEMDTRGYVDEGGQKHDPTDKLGARDVLVMDEAGMSGSRQTAALIADAEQAGAKVVLVGDSRQLQAIDAGAAFRAIEERTGSVSLSDSRRQNQEEDRQAVRDLRDGHAEEALSNLSARDRVHESESGREAKQETGRAVADDLSQGKLSLALTGTRAEARDVNEHAREAAKEKGLVQGEDIPVSTAHGERQFAEGDRVIFTRNSKDLDVKNGDLGTVREVLGQDGQAKMKIELDRGGEREIDTRQYDHLDHGYAVTTHKAQGSTVDRAHVLASENGMSSREWSYVAASRAREETHIHGDRATLAEIAPAWSKARQKDVTLDYEKKPEHEQKKEPERDRAPVREWKR